MLSCASNIIKQLIIDNGPSKSCWNFTVLTFKLKSVYQDIIVTFPCFRRCMECSMPHPSWICTADLTGWIPPQLVWRWLLTATSSSSSWLVSTLLLLILEIQLGTMMKWLCVCCSGEGDRSIPWASIGLCRSEDDPQRATSTSKPAQGASG